MDQSILASFGSWPGILSICLLVLLDVITYWRIFVKAKRHGWAALIPIYNLYVLIKIARRPGWWLLLYAIPVVNIIVHGIVSIDTAKAFHKNTAFGILLLWLMPFIGYPVLAFGDATYRHERGPEKDLPLKPVYQRLLIGASIIIFMLCIGGTVAAVYYRYQAHKVRDQVTTMTTKFHNVGFDTLDEWNNDYRMTVMYPKTDDARINSASRAKIDGYVNNFRALVAKKPAGSQPYYLHVIGSINFASNEVINFMYTGTWTIDGKTGDIEVNALFNRATGKEVQAADLFKGNHYLSVASDAARTALPTILGKNYNKVLAEQGTMPQTSNFDQYEIVDSKTITIIFEPGQVANPSLGTIKVPLSLDSLSNDWNRDAVSKLFPNFIAELQAKEAAEAAAAKKLADEQAAAQAAAQKAAQASRQSGNYLPAHGDVDCSRAKCIALSFDDGPGAGTDTILDTLEQYHVPATFMVVGLQVNTHAAQLKREAADGNDIGSHTWDHADLTSLSTAGIQSEVNRTQQAVMNIIGKQPFMLRPPYGAYNQTVLRTVGMPLILWSVDPDDWKDRDANIVYQRVMSHVHAGAIVLSHDIYPTTAAAYQRIIPDLIQQGYTLVTVSNLEGINPAHLTPEVFTGKY